jgi:hypothetical protein
MQELPKASKPAVARRRPRAPVACLLCRSRRVRCDVSETAIPCSNCRFYKQECVVSEKKKYGVLLLFPQFWCLDCYSARTSLFYVVGLKLNADWYFGKGVN